MIKLAFFFTTISIIVTGTTYFLIKRRLGLTPKAQKILLAVMSFCALVMIAGPIYYRAGDANISSPFTFSVAFFHYYMMGWIGITLIVFGSAEILQFAFKAFDPSKRMFMTEGVAKGLLATTSLASVAGYIQLKTGPYLEKVSIKMSKLPQSFDGFTIAQISDIHIGPLLQKEFLEKIVDQILALDADIIAITGDLVDGSVNQLRDHVEPLRRLTARHGIYFCTGNHEYYSGVSEWCAHLETMGIHVFKNTNKIIEKKTASGTEKIMLAGVYDFLGHRYSNEFQFDPVKAAETHEDVSCKILMVHNPQAGDVCAKAGFHLQLCGHTHAGQFYPFVFIAKLAHKYFEGYYQIDEHSHIYVNRGTGFWGPPNRLGKNSEITLITLRA